MSEKGIKRSCWCGGASKDSPLPIGNKVKHESSAAGSGGLGTYEDTTEAIKSQQNAGAAKMRSSKSGRGN